MIRFDSISDWKSYCFNTHKSYIKNKYFSCWIKKKRIDIFNYASLGNEELNNIKISVENALNVCESNFKIQLFKRRFHGLDFAVKKEILIGSRILNMVKKSRKRDKSCNACIFLVNKRIKSDAALLEFGDALTYVSDGITVFTFDPSIKYPMRFFKDEVAHEIYHLLGLNVHHEDTKVGGYKNLASCNMECNAPSEVLCRKCKDGLLSFWEGIRHAKN